MQLNSTAVALWVFLAIIGYLFAGTTGALVGLAVGLGLSLLADFLS